jgi:VWFA-related protein
MRVVLACLATLLAVQTLSGAQVFRAAVDGVTMDVLVTRDGKPVAGLSRDEFTLTDNGVAQRVDAMEMKDVAISVLFALDTSESLEGPRLATLIGAAEAATAVLKPDDRVGVLTFSQRPRLVMPFGAPGSAKPFFASVRAGGATALYDAMFSAIAMRSLTPGRTLILAFSDGADTVSWLDSRDVVKAAQRSDLVLHAVTVQQQRITRDIKDVMSDDADRMLFQEEPHLMSALFLGELTRAAGGTVLAADSAGLRDAFLRLVNEFRSRYLLTYVPEGVGATGWHAVEVKVKGRGLRVQARAGYLR